MVSCNRSRSRSCSRSHDGGSIHDYRTSHHHDERPRYYGAPNHQPSYGPAYQSSYHHEQRLEPQQHSINKDSMFMLCCHDVMISLGV